MVYSKNRLTSRNDFVNKRRPVVTFGALYGLQRNYKNRISLDVNAGLGYRFAASPFYDEAGMRTTSVEGDMRVLFGINLGIWLNKRV